MPSMHESDFRHGPPRWLCAGSATQLYEDGYWPFDSEWGLSLGDPGSYGAAHSCNDGVCFIATCRCCEK